MDNRPAITGLTIARSRINERLSIMWNEFQILQRMAVKNPEMLNSARIIRQNLFVSFRDYNNIFDLISAEDVYMEVISEVYDLVSILKKMTDSIIDLVMTDLKVDLVFKTKLDSLYASIDLAKLEVVLYNLISNAVRYANTGARNKVTVTLKENNNHAVIYVRSTGQNADVSSVINILNTHHVSGISTMLPQTSWGLALAVASKLAHIMGISLAFKPDIKAGTSFIINLPKTNELPSSSVQERDKKYHPDTNMIQLYFSDFM